MMMMMMGERSTPPRLRPPEIARAEERREGLMRGLEGGGLERERNVA